MFLKNNKKRLRGKLGKPAILEDWISTVSPLITAGESTNEVTFDWDEEIGLPGGFLVQNLHHSEFYLMTLTLENVPGHGKVHFVCNSWVYPAKNYTKDRIFFANKAYLPSETPELLRPYREEEMIVLRGNGTGMLEEWDRVYDYAFYNDLGEPDDEDKVRPVIGGSSEYPYPRRGRTGRPPTEKDPETESRLSLIQFLNIYVPRDERFGHIRMSDFLAQGLEAILKFLLPEFEALFDDTIDEFDTFEDFLKLYDGGIKLPKGPLFDNLLENVPIQFVKELLRSDGEGLLKYSTPQIIRADLSAWSTDEEFAREMVAGVNPVFPPISKLDVELYGNQNSSIRSHHIQDQLEGLEVNEVTFTVCLQGIEETPNNIDRLLLIYIKLNIQINSQGALLGYRVWS
ncbi:putative linoleate 13S-lipoxygenase [Helianthus anomalus]